MWTRFLMADARYAARVLIRCPRFTVPCVLMIAAGIALSTVVFAVFDAEVLRVLPYPESERLVAIGAAPPNSPDLSMSLAPSQVSHLQHKARALQDVACYELTGVSIAAGSAAWQEPAAIVSPNFFRALVAVPRIGRSLAPEEVQSGGTPTVVISSSLWRRVFAANPNAIGRSINLNGIPHVVAGVMPEEFRFPMTRVGLWIPEPLAETPEANGVILRVAFGRLTRGFGLDAVRAELDVLAKQYEVQYPAPGGTAGWILRALPLRDVVIGPTGKILAVILVAVLLLQVMACVNVSSLFLARSRDRLQEIGIRLAVGASPSRLFQQVFLESTLLAFAGGALGLAGAVWVIGLAHPLTQALVRDAAEPSINAAVVAFSLAMAVGSSLLFGIGPALSFMGMEIRSSLAGVAQSRGGRLLDKGKQWRRVLPAIQIALASLLLVAFGLVLRTLFSLTNVELGFQPHGVIAVTLGRSSLQWPRSRDALRQMLEEVQRWPEVQSAAIGTTAPFSGMSVRTLFSGEASNSGWTKSPMVMMQIVSDDYFRTLRIPFSRGRSFNQQDRAKAPCVAIVNQTLGRLLWPAEVPLGRRLDLNLDPSAPYLCEVVGVVKDVKDAALDASPAPTVYFPYLQRATGVYVLLIRHTDDRVLPADRIIATAKGADPSISFISVKSVSLATDESVVPADVRAKLLGGFAALALLLACVGLYATEAYSVSRRMHEMGVRMVLGATGNDVIAVTLRRSVLTAASGLAVGLGSALVATRLASGLLLFNVSPSDPLTYLCVAAILLAVALGAGLVPARHAASVDPAALLRTQ